MFDWDRGNIEHIFRHDIEPLEAEEVFFDPDRCVHNAHDGNKKIIGKTEDGRILTIVYIKREKKIRPITGWMPRKRKENHITEEGGKGMDNNKKNKKMVQKMFEDETKVISSQEKVRDEKGRIIIHDLIEIPENMTEEETVRFWNTHAMSEDLLEDTYIEEDEDDLPPPRKQSTKPINLRIENNLLIRLQKVADIKNIPYQTLLKQFVAERVYEEEKREKILT